MVMYGMGWQTAIHLVTWYCFSASATFTNRVLIKQHHVSAEMLTLSHLFVSVICDCEPSISTLLNPMCM